MIGIGGAGMCGLAEMLADKGYRVSGSDAAAGSITAHLQERGLEIYHGHLAEQLADDVDMVVISSAIPADNQELQAARERGLMVIKRGTLLAQLFNQTKGIAVAGAHSKTTGAAGHQARRCAQGRLLRRARRGDHRALRADGGGPHRADAGGLRGRPLRLRGNPGGG